MRRQRIKPSKEMSRVTFVIGILFSIFGFVMLIGALMTPISIIVVPFFIIWTAIAVFNTYSAYRNGFTEDGIALYEVETSENGEKNQYNFDEKLRKIERLRNEGLITEDEYRMKREAIMKEDW